MARSILGESRPAFRIRRPLVTSNGFGSDIDKTIAAQLAELDALLGKRVFDLVGHNATEFPGDDAAAAEHEADAAERRADAAERASDATADDVNTLKEAERALAAEKKSAAAAQRQAKKEARAAAALERAVEAFGADSLDPEKLLQAVLGPKRFGDEKGWSTGSLADQLSDAEAHDGAMTLAELIDGEPELSELSGALDGALRDDLFTMSEKARTILGGSYRAIRDYLVIVGYAVKQIKDVDGLKNFIVNTRGGAAMIADYAVISAARAIVDRKALNVPDVNDDDGRFVKDLRARNLSLTATSFEKAVLQIVDKRVSSTAQLDLLAGAEIGPIPEALKDDIVRRMKASPIPFTKSNVNYLLPSVIADAAGDPALAQPDPIALEESEKDFDVDFFEDDAEQIQVNRSAVKCAAQLYFTMVAGDELDVFGVVNYFTHKYLLRSGIEIQDRRLRDDLQSYVFSNRFTDLKTGRVIDRTRPAERQMFASQVFRTGGGQVSEDLIVNEDFPRLWKVLILESAQYLERAQQSPHPDSYVSRQNVMQAVEDLQYNLSTHCTGMATVITPLMYQELNFVIRRILMHPEVVRQVVPAGGGWSRVVERLYTEAKHTCPNATVLYNKARLGHDIIKSISAYNPATFENDDQFSAFISQVDAFITTQSILQEAITDDLKREQEAPDRYDAEPPPPAAEQVGAAPAASNGHPADEWDF